MPTQDQIDAQIAAVTGKPDWGGPMVDEKAAIIEMHMRQQAHAKANGLDVPEEVAVASTGSPEPQGLEEVPAPEVAPASEGVAPAEQVPTYPQRLRLRARILIDHTRALLAQSEVGVQDSRLIADLDKAVLYLETADEFEGMQG